MLHTGLHGRGGRTRTVHSLRLDPEAQERQNDPSRLACCDARVSSRSVQRASTDRSRQSRRGRHRPPPPENWQERPSPQQAPAARAKYISPSRKLPDPRATLSARGTWAQDTTCHEIWPWGLPRCSSKTFLGKPFFILLLSC